MRKEVGKEERGARGGVDRRSDNATSVDVEIDPHRRRLGRSQTDFALRLQAIVECLLVAKHRSALTSLKMEEVQGSETTVGTARERRYGVHERLQHGARRD